jgi:hypothetical protein
MPLAQVMRILDFCISGDREEREKRHFHHNDAKNAKKTLSFMFRLFLPLATFACTQRLRACGQCL